MEKFDPMLLRALATIYGGGQAIAYLDPPLDAPRRSVLPEGNTAPRPTDVTFAKIAEAARANGLLYFADLIQEKVAHPELGIDLPELQRCLDGEFEHGLVLMRIPKDRSEYFEKDELFGPVVASNFPSVEREVREAGNCIAAGRGTACVFHLMRVVEVGLHALAATLRIKIKRSRPTWSDYTTAIENRFKAKPNKKKNRLWKHEKCATSVRGRIAGIRDAWRNDTVHDIAVSYSPEQAQMVFDLVKDLMQTLADYGLKEK